MGNKILIRTAKATPDDLEISKNIKQITLSTRIIIFENSEKVMKLLSHIYVKKEQHKQNNNYISLWYVRDAKNNSKFILRVMSRFSKSTDEIRI